jgi:lipid-A-disaccharide synthase
VSLKKLQGSGIPCVHYVAPSVWAYRPKRAAKIAKLYQHLLALLPFEPPYFEKEGLACSFIGHSIIEDARTEGSAARFQSAHALAADTPLLCVMPGSRKSELTRLWPVFSETLQRLKQQLPGLAIVIPTIPTLVETLIPLTQTLPFPVILTTKPADKQDAFAASTVALAKSGTNTLELGLANVPMVVAYKVKPSSAWLAKRLLRIRYVSLVNLIENREVIPEYLQENCTAEKLEAAVLSLLHSKDKRHVQQQGIHSALVQLGLGQTPAPSTKAAQVILGMVKG